MIHITPEMSLDDVANAILDKLIEQGGPCIFDGACMYGSPDNSRHCAVGWLLPEDREDLMGFIGDVNGLCNLSSRLGPVDLGPNDQWIRDNLPFLGRMQFFHDCGSDEFFMGDPTKRQTYAKLFRKASSDDPQ